MSVFGPTWYGEVVRLPDRELAEPTRRRLEGEFFWAEGKVLEKMLDRGLGSVTMGEL